MNTIPCRACGEFIRFIETPRGRKMPVDPEEVTERFDPRLTGGPDQVVLVLENGQTVAGVRATAGAATVRIVTGYVPHWATCTQPQQHRRP